MIAGGKHPRSSRVRDRTSGRYPKAVVMPPVTWGRCRAGVTGRRVCREVGDLAAGLCVYHWDRGLDKRFYERFDERDTDDQSAVE